MLRTDEREIVLDEAPQIHGSCPDLERQHTDVWCWAACVRMAIVKFNVTPSDSQCQVAQKGIAVKTGQNVTCCPKPRIPDCFASLSRENITELWRREYSALDVTPFGGSIDINCLKEELDLNHLVELRYSLDVSHVLLVCAWSESSDGQSFIMRNPNDEGMTTKPAGSLSYICGLGDWNFTWIIKKREHVKVAEALKEDTTIVTSNEISSDHEPSGIAEQIGKLLPAVYSVPKTERRKVTLRQSFEVWTIDVKDILNARENVSFPAHHANYRHHQIAIAGRAAAFALSKLSSGSEYVTEVTMSPIAERIESAISNLSVDLSDETVARMVAIRSLGVYAFWLVQSDRIYVVSVPAYLKKLSRGQELSTRDFMNNLYDDLGEDLSKLVDKEDERAVPW